MPLGAKLDDGSVAVGAALLAVESRAAKVEATLAAAAAAATSEGGEQSDAPAPLEDTAEPDTTGE